LLAALCDLEVSPEAESFRLSPAFKKNEEYWWPGDSTPFAEMRRLLPNFSISLVTGHCQRFWPTGPFQEMDSGEAIHFIANRLSALMRGIARRGNVLVSITAGLDSRMVLAASRDLTDTLGFMTVQQSGMPSLHADLQIPRRLALHLGFEHEIVNSAPHVRETFRRAYQDSVMHFHEKWLPDAQAIYDAYQQDSLIVVGSMAETGRLFYGGLSSDDRLVPAQLAGMANLDDHPFAVRAFEQWLETARNPYNYSLADLFYWEQRAGRWLATSQLEFGHVWRDIFAPFNSREILSSMLAVDQALRRPPQSVMFRELLSHMWPDVLSEPINPHEATSPASPAVRLARKIRRKLRQYLA